MAAWQQVLISSADNDAVMGYDPAPRAPLDLPAYYRNSKDNSYVCKAHANNNCKQCCELSYPSHHSTPSPSPSALAASVV